MHYKIYQLTKEKVNKESWINASTFEEDCPNKEMDYVGDIKDDMRKELLKSLVKDALPKGCFKLAGKNKIRYVGGLVKFKQVWIEQIYEKASSLDIENFHHQRSDLMVLMGNPTHTWSKVYTDEGYYTELADWLLYECRNLKVGDILHVGGIVDFHI